MSRFRKVVAYTLLWPQHFFYSSEHTDDSNQRWRCVALSICEYLGPRQTLYAMHRICNVLYPRECSWPAQRRDRLTHDDGRLENTDPVKNKSPSLYDFLSSGRYLLDVPSITSLESNFFTALMIRKVPVLSSQVQNAMHFISFCFYLEYIGYWTQAKDGRLCPKRDHCQGQPQTP